MGELEEKRAALDALRKELAEVAKREALPFRQLQLAAMLMSRYTHSLAVMAEQVWGRVQSSADDDIANPPEFSVLLAMLADHAVVSAALQLAIREAVSRPSMDIVQPVTLDTLLSRIEDHNRYGERGTEWAQVRRSVSNGIRIGWYRGDDLVQVFKDAQRALHESATSKK